MPKIRCREIADVDHHAVVNLLAEGFPVRSGERWAGALKRLSDDATLSGFPRYGYMLESAGQPVGVLLLIFASIMERGDAAIRCNVSSWYVRPDFRSYAPLLVSNAIRRRDVTYFNVSPAPHTLPVLEAQGYSRYCDGLLLTLPLLCRRSSDAQVRKITSGVSTHLPAVEETLLLRHSAYGCIALLCVSHDGVFPFVFAPCRASIKRARAPYARLVYCRDAGDFIRFARPLGLFLARCGFLLVMIDSNGRGAELPGFYLPNRPKYFKGPHKPRLGDLAYSEVALFDVEPARPSKFRAARRP